MALTRPRLGQLTTTVSSLSDALTVLHAGATAPNVDVGFLMNRANGLVSNVALYWNEAGNTFVTAFTSNSGATDTNVSVTSYANVTTGKLVVNGTLTASTVNAATIGNTNAVLTGSTLTLTSYANIAGPLVVTNNTAVSSIQITGTATKGGAGYHDFLSVTNQGGGTNPNKYFRLNNTGNFEIINSAYTSNLFTLTDDGNITIPGKITVNALYTTTGLFWSGNNNVISSGGGGSAPAGSTGQVQYNNGGTLGATAMYYFTGNSAHITTGNVVAGQVYTTNNGNGTNYAVGDDIWIGDINVANTMGLRGQQDPTQAYIVFGSSNNTNTIGRSGTGPITISGNTSVTSTFYAQGIYDTGNRVLSSVTVTAGTGMSGGGTISGPSGTVTLTNAGVTSLTAGGNISVSASTGGITISGTNAGVTGVFAGTGISVSASTGGVTITNGGVTGLSSSGAGNLTVSASIGAVTVALPTSGPGAATVGSSTAIPVITTDAYGRISSTSTAAVVAPAGTLSGATLASGVTASSLTSVGTLTGLTVSNSTAGSWTSTLTNGSLGGTIGNQVLMQRLSSTNSNSNYLEITETRSQTGVSWTTAATRIQEKIDATWMGFIQFNGNVNGGITFGTGTSTTSAISIPDRIYIDTSGNFYPTVANTQTMGTSTNWWSMVYGKAIQAQYADLAENYKADAEYTPGTVVVFGGNAEITTTVISHDTRVAGVISTNPAYLMNTANPGLPVAMTGRVPCQVQGPVTKGQVLVTSTTPGVAQAINNSQFVPGCVVGKALEAINTNTIETIEVVVGRF